MQPITTARQLGAIFAARRRELKLPQRALAERVGISQNRLSELEDMPERLTLQRVLDLANVLGLELMVGPRTRSSGVDW